MNRRGRHARWPLLISLLLLFALIPFAFLRSSQVPEAEAAWWNESWQYRQSIAVTNNTTQQTNVYISVSLDTSNTSKFQADCGDLRFTKQNGQLLPYYIVSGCGTASTSVHFQLDTFPAGAQTFYAYYGNPSADNGFSGNDFLTEATNYTVGGTGSEETGPGPVAYWKFDEGSGSVVYDSATYSMSNELLVDGDMEAADTSDWTAATSTLSKETSNPYSGSNSLRVSNSAAPTHAWARQTIVSAGKKYRVSGYAKSDGVNTPLVYVGGVKWSGTTATSWQTIDVEFTVSVGTNLNFGAYNMTTGGYVEFDDISVRQIGSVNQGTISGATWATEDQCVSGKCLSLDGADDYVNMGNVENANFTSSDAFTLSVWVNPSTTGESGYVVGKNSIGRGYGLYWSGGSDAIALASGVSYAAYISDPVFTEYGTWVHIIAVFDNGNVSYYKNGQPSGTFSGHSFSTPTSDDNVLVGNRNGGAAVATFFSGLIDEPKIFPYALTEDQIKAEYNLGAAAVMGTGPTVAPPAGGTLSDSLVAYWALDEQYGQIAHDKVGNNHGTFGASTSPGSDDPTWKPAGECKVNGCLGLDGGDYLNVADNDSLSFGNNTTDTPFSISVWVKMVDATNFRIINKVNSVLDSSWEYSFGSVSGTDNMELHFYDGGGSIQLYYKSTDPLTYYENQWIHLAAVYAGQSQDTSIKVYLDGKELAGTTTKLSYVAMSNSSNTLEIGRMKFGPSYAQGLIDELKIYNTALTADQVKQDMNAGASVAYSVGSEEADELADGAGAPPIAEWKFDEKQGTLAYDSSGNANDGTVSGATWKSGCKQGACLEFDGNSSYVDVYSSNLNSVFNSEKGTLTAWAKVSDPSVWADGTTRYIVKLGANTNNQIFLAKSSASDLLTSWYRAGGITESVTINPAATTDYFQVSMTWDKTAGGGAGEHKFYLNGTQVGSAQAIEGVWAGELSSTLNVIGTNSTTPSGTWKGQIDHVKVYDYARTPAQIAYDYNRGAPVAHWKFDECEGTVAHDSSGNENHGTINIGATGTQTTAGTCSTSGAWANGASGKFEGSLSFDSTDDNISGPDTSGLLNGNGTARTVTAWIKQNEAAQQRVVSVFQSQGSMNPQYSLFVTAAQKARVQLVNNSGTLFANNHVSLSSFSLNVWQHIAFTYDMSQLKIYINGQLDRTYALTEALRTDTSPYFYIGQRGDGPGSESFSGQIDDVRIYNYALSPSQIQKVFNQGYGVRYGN